MRSMQRPVALLLTLLFMIWILPLGAFIKLSQEKAVCGGHRAICMCSAMKTQIEHNPLEKCGIRSNPGSNNDINDAPGFGSGTHYILTSNSPNQKASRVSVLRNPEFLNHRNLFSRQVDHVPIHRIFL